MLETIPWSRDGKLVHPNWIYIYISSPIELVNIHSKSFGYGYGYVLKYPIKYWMDMDI